LPQVKESYAEGILERSIDKESCLRVMFSKAVLTGIKAV
jgi:hypothetical protein